MGGFSHVNTIGGVEFCEDEIDAVWEIQWPNTLVGETAKVPCGVNFVGNCAHSVLHFV